MPGKTVEQDSSIGLGDKTIANLVSGIITSNFTPDSVFALFRKIPLDLNDPKMIPLLSAFFAIPEQQQLETVQTLTARAEVDYPGIMDDLPEGAYRIFAALWQSMHTFEEAVQIFTDTEPQRIRQMPIKAIREEIELYRESQGKPDISREYTISINIEENPLDALRRHQHPETAEFAPAYEKLKDPGFCRRLWGYLTELPSEKLSTMKQEIEFEGVRIPLFQKHSETQYEREKAFIKHWLEKDRLGYYTHSALQVPKEIEGIKSIIMLDLSRLGFIHTADVYKSVNGFTHPGRQFMLEYITWATEWLADVENIGISPLDNFPIEGFCVYPEYEIGQLPFRTYDYGLFRRAKESDDFREIWYPETGDLSRYQTACSNIPLLTSLIYDKIESDPYVFPDSELSMLHFYDRLNSLLRGSTPVTNRMLNKFFRTILYEYNQRTNLHQLDTILRGSQDFPLRPLYALGESLTALSEEERKVLIKIIQNNAENHIVNVDEWYKYFIINYFCGYNPEKWLSRVAGSLRCSVDEVIELLEHAPGYMFREQFNLQICQFQKQSANL